ncbi:uncharacterized protein udt [Ochlerotatus camptorhynchus]|uniref:uncharacterized protein udt n=1 Tax=Ochlerotatus camptorhynchus TaxID=644619 RepID=UPI0031DD5B69
MNFNLVVILLAAFGCAAVGAQNRCEIPKVLQGTWFSWEVGEPTSTAIDEWSYERQGPKQGRHKIECIESARNGSDHTFIFKGSECYVCVKAFPRTLNVFEKFETPCVTLDRNEKPSMDRICRGLRQDQQRITLFNKNFIPISCRSSLEGVWHFAYQNRFRFTGECDSPDAKIQSCQTPGTQFLIQNQKFNITYRQCQGMDGTFNGVVEFSCLGDWFIGKNHYFAVVNTKESREDEKYRCFLKNRDDDLYIGASITAECNTLNTVEKSPERYRVTPVKSDVVEPGCRFPQNFTGEWINTANIDAEVTINETHIIETYYPDRARYRRTIYICREQRDTRIMMARLTVDGCQTDYICFDFVPRHHNVIRYRKGTAVIKNDFSTVCSWVQFPNKEEWRYDLYLAAKPVPVRCPVAGKFNFTQQGESPFKTRILGGVTLSPRPDIRCKQNISDFSVCDTDQKEMAIDANYCLSVDYLGRPVDIYSDPDYRMKCIGYWQENLKSYLITFDDLDPLSKYRCWVYQRAELNRIQMSQAVGAFCDLKQSVTSWNYTEGAVVALDMTEYERERDQCPMHFDDGENPWQETENYIKVFPWLIYRSATSTIDGTVNAFLVSLAALLLKLLF